MAIGVAGAIVDDPFGSRAPAGNDGLGSGLADRVPQGVGIVALSAITCLALMARSRSAGAALTSATLPGESVIALGRPTTSVSERVDLGGLAAARGAGCLRTRRPFH